MVGGHRFRVEGIGGIAGNASLTQGADESRFVDDRAPRGIDQQGAPLHLAQFVWAHEAARARRQHAVDRQNVGAPEQLVLADPFGTMLACALLGQVFAPGDRLHANAGSDPGDPGAEIAEPNNAQRLAVEIEAERFCQAPPGRMVWNSCRRFRANASIRRDGQLGRGKAAAAGATYGDAVILGGFEIDRGVALAGGHQQLEARQLFEKGAGNGVRSRMMPITSKLASARARASTSPMRALKTWIRCAVWSADQSASAQRHVLVIVEKCDAGHAAAPSLAGVKSRHMPIAANWLR